MARSRPIRDLGLAVTLLTALPVPVKMPAEGERRDVACWFPLIGLVFGVLLAGVALIGHRYLPATASTGAVLILFALAAATRFLHWDGLADVADGWFVPKERRLEVLADTHIGAFGAIVVVFAAIAQVNAVVELAVTPQGAALLVLAPLFGRAAATFSAWLGKPARPGGLGSSVMGSPSFHGLVIALVSTVLGVFVSMIVFDASLVALMVTTAVAILLAAGVPHLIAMRFGGVTGDTMGASVVVTETAVLVFAAAVFAILPLVGVHL